MLQLMRFYKLQRSSQDNRACYHLGPSLLGLGRHAYNPKDDAQAPDVPKHTKKISQDTSPERDEFLQSTQQTKYRLLHRQHAIIRLKGALPNLKMKSG